MDNKGFIFTIDAILALVVVIVLASSIVTYQHLPVYMGEDHQHLEALASSVLDVMEQDGSLSQAVNYYDSNNYTAAQSIINNETNSLIPNNVNYNMTINSNLTVPNSNSGNTPKDTVTKVKIIYGQTVRLDLWR